MAQFTINWPNANITQDKEDFLRANPNQTLNEGEKNLTDLQWIKRKIALLILGQVERGARQRIEEAQLPIVAPDIIVD